MVYSTKDGKEVYTPALFDLGVKVIITNAGGDILALRRSVASGRGHGWDLIGGGCDIGEDPADAAVREAREETGLEVHDVRPIATHVYIAHRESGDAHVCVIGYRAKADSEAVVLSWEHEGFEWMEPEDVLKLDLPETHMKFVRIFVEECVEA